MEQDLTEWAYQSMACGLMEDYRMPGVENAFAEGSYCLQRYGDMRDAYDRLCDRLGVVDEDQDVEDIINAFMDIQEELCRRMYRYGAQFGMGDSAHGKKRP